VSRIPTGPPGRHPPILPAAEHEVPMPGPMLLDRLRAVLEASFAVEVAFL
jgi:hypothetical protein